jgi:hypothetical protein
MTFCLIVSLWSGWRESQVRQERFANEDGSMTVGKRVGLTPLSLCKIYVHNVE